VEKACIWVYNDAMDLVSFLLSVTVGGGLILDDDAELLFGFGVAAPCLKDFK
jgi:hypothetical protein